MSPLTGVIREAWALYKAHAGHFLLISFAVYVVAAVIDAVLSTFARYPGSFFAGIVNLFFMFLLQAALVKAVQDVRDGRVDLDLRATLSAALPYVLPVALASILASIAIAIGFVLIIVPGLILLTFWSLIVPCIVIGEARPLESFGRSWRTVRGYAWRVFGTYVVVFLILVAVRVVLTAVLFALPIAARSFISDIVAGTLIAPFIALVVTLVYYRLTAVHTGEPPTAGMPADPAWPPPPGGWATPAGPAAAGEPPVPGSPAGPAGPAAPVDQTIPRGPAAPDGRAVPEERPRPGGPAG
jgi:hypothetical protein